VPEALRPPPGDPPVSKLTGRIPAGTVALRPASPVDDAFLRALDGAVVTEQLGLGGLPDGVRAQLLELQFTARRRDRETRFPDADRQVILLDGASVGAVILDRRADGFRVVDIALISPARRRRIAATVLAAVSAAADEAGCPVRAMAACENNASRRLFEAAGFAQLGDDGVNVSLERPARRAPPG